MLLLLAGLPLQWVFQRGAWLCLLVWELKVALCALQAALLTLTALAVCALLLASRQSLVPVLSLCEVVVDQQAAR
jgi:hypothetical protein